MNPAEFQNLMAAEERMWWFRGMREIFRRIVLRDVSVPMLEVLDAGCGTGANAEWMAREFGWRVWCLDYAAEGLEAARRRAGLRGFARGDIRCVPFRGSSFDMVTCFDVIAHLEPGEEVAAFREFARCLRPGGWLFVRASAFGWLRSRHSEYVNERQRVTLGRLCAGLREAGFDVLRATYANSLLLPVALVKFRVWEPLVRAPAASGVQLGPWWLERLLHLPLRAEAWWIGRGGAFPLGQSAIALARRR
ncbi:MAG: class I SAM-dependent methyltransferase [Bryobacteraceae bacterium]|nr:class I SAM-dependent methyltransferase [Bryobacteraceae bacterium]MCX7603282.1 class I SAM-dependent methyltransferase [Bryobacteraceae bacterium]